MNMRLSIDTAWSQQSNTPVTFKVGLNGVKVKDSCMFSINLHNRSEDNTIGLHRWTDSTEI